jgi:hypothetical protein
MPDPQADECLFQVRYRDEWIDVVPASRLAALRAGLERASDRARGARRRELAMRKERDEAQAEIAELRAGLAKRGIGAGRNPDGVDDTVAIALLALDEALDEVERLRAEDAYLRDELGYRPRESNGYCEACGVYVPRRHNGARVEHDCDRTPPVGKLPPTLFACPTCGGHGASAFGCWGTLARPHEHVFMERVHEIVADRARLTARLEEMEGELTAEHLEHLEYCARVIEEQQQARAEGARQERERLTAAIEGLEVRRVITDDRQDGWNLALEALTAVLSEEESNG